MNASPTLLLNEDHAGRQGVCGAKEIDEQSVLKVGMAEKAKEFVENGAEVYTQA